MTGEEATGADEAPLAKDLFAVTEYQASPPHVFGFEPWHRPRKQFVRRHQWLAQISRLGARPGMPLSYLGLPGADLIDLRLIHREICEPHGRALTFLGFNRQLRLGDTGLNTSLDEVRRLPLVDERSEVLGDDIRLLADPASIAWKRATAIGPFDVINLDLCDSLAGDEPSVGSLYDAISHLFGLQVRNQHPWLLLVTTRVGRTHLDAVAAGRLVAQVRQNVEKCASFVAKCQELLGLDAAGVTVDGCSPTDFFNVVIVALCKWIAGLVLGAVGSPSRIELTSVQAYRVDPTAGHYDLVSFAIRFLPILAPMADSAGLGTAVPSHVDECGVATRIVGRVAKTVPVEDVLSGNASMVEELIAEVEQMLASARYPASAYRNWLISSSFET